ncbi:MAG: hypothetical protein ACJ741_02140 [Pyrinomonadaceae bacterium]
MRSTSLTTRLLTNAVVLASALVSGTALAQTAAPQKTTPPAAAPKAGTQTSEAQPPWKLSVSKQTKMLSLTAKNARLTEIAAALGSKLKVPVVLSPLMQKQSVTLEVANVPLEGLVRMLSPVPYIDYELSGDGAVQPRVMGIYLYAFNEEPPAKTASVKGSNEAILIQGDTEEGTEAYEKRRDKEDSPLNVKVDHNRVSVRARKQPLSVILFEIASKVDIPFDMKYESSDLVDLDFSNYTLEQAVRALSPNVRLYSRTNLSNYESTPLRLSLVPPADSQ